MVDAGAFQREGAEARDSSALWSRKIRKLKGGKGRQRRDGEKREWSRSAQGRKNTTWNKEKRELYVMLAPV